MEEYLNENIRVVSVMAGLKMEGIVNGGVLNCMDYCSRSSE